MTATRSRASRSADKNAADKNAADAKPDQKTEQQPDPVSAEITKPKEGPRPTPMVQFTSAIVHALDCPSDQLADHAASVLAACQKFLSGDTGNGGAKARPIAVELSKL